MLNMEETSVALWWFLRGRVWKHVFARYRLVGGRSELRGILGWVVAKYDELQPVLRAPMSHVLSAFQIGRTYSRARQTDDKGWPPRGRRGFLPTKTHAAGVLETLDITVVEEKLRRELFASHQSHVFARTVHISCTATGMLDRAMHAKEKNVYVCIRAAMYPHAPMSPQLHDAHEYAQFVTLRLKTCMLAGKDSAHSSCLTSPQGPHPTHPTPHVC